MLYLVRHGQTEANARGLLLGRGFQPAAVNAMCQQPRKFLWPDLLAFWNDKSPETVTQCAEILTRMDVLTDPGDHMEALVQVLAQRSLLAKCLVKADRIKMGVPKLVRELERLAQLDSETIQACLADDFLAPQGHPENRVVPREPAVGAVVDALVGDVQRREQPDHPAETLAGQRLRTPAQDLQVLGGRRRDQGGAIPRGNAYGPYDVLIAGQASQRGLALVTRNLREFRRVPGLAVEDWEAADPTP